jgi:hypothetical protein
MEIASPENVFNACTPGESKIIANKSNTAIDDFITFTLKLLRISCHK